MRRLAAIIVALVLPGLALAQNLYPTPADWRAWDRDYASPGGSTEVMRLPLTQSGAGFDCTGAASCMSFDGASAAPVDSTGKSWAVNGTVAAVPSTALPTTASTGGATGWSSTAYLSDGTGADSLDASGNRFGCVSFVLPGSGLVADNSLISNGTAGVGGYYVGVSDTGRFSIVSYTPTSALAQTSVSLFGAPLNGFSVGCFWRTGSSLNAKVNRLGTNTNASAGTEASGATSQHRIGAYQTGTPNGAGITILGVVEGVGDCPSPPSPYAASCEGWATYQIERQFGMVGPRGEVLSVSRTTTASNATYGHNGRVWNAASGIPRITSQGLLVERGTTNSALRTRDITDINSWASTGTPTITGDQGPTGFTDLDKMQSNANTDARYNTVTVTSSTGPWSVSATIASDSGSKVESLLFGVNGGQTLTGCSCYRESKAACTFATTTANQGYAYGTFSTTPDRMTIVCAATTAQTTIYPGFHDGQYNSTNNVGGMFGRLQVETGSTSTTECPSTTAACTRGVDIATVSLPAGLLPTPSRWCVTATAAAYSGTWPASGRKNIWATGTRGATNSAGVYDNGGWFAPHVYGSPGNFYAYTATLGTPPTALKTWVNGGVAGGSVNGVNVPVGTGNAMTGQPNTLYLGSDSTATAAEFADAYIRDLRIYRSPTCR